MAAKGNKGKGKEPEAEPEAIPGRKKLPSGHQQESAEYIAAEKLKKEKNQQKRLEKARQAARPREEVYEERLQNRENTTVVEEVKIAASVKKPRAALQNLTNAKPKKKPNPPAAPLPASQPPAPRQPPRPPTNPAPAPAPLPPALKVRVRRFANLPLPGQASDEDEADEEDPPQAGARTSLKRKSKTEPKLPQQVLPDDEYLENCRSEDGSDSGASNYQGSDEENEPGPSKKRRFDVPADDESTNPDDELFEDDQNNDEDDQNNDEDEQDEQAMDEDIGPLPDDDGDVVGEDDEEGWADNDQEQEPAPGESSRTARAPKRKARGSGPRRERPKAGNYQSLTKNVLKIAWGYYRTLLATRNPFPSPEKADEYAFRAWRFARKQVGQPELKATKQQITLITNRGSQMRGDLKTLTRTHTRSLYRFLRRKSMVSRNLALYRQLTNDFAYDPSKAPAMRWCHSILFEVLMDMWFYRRTSEGVQFPALFNGTIPAPTIALVFTVVYNCIQEWSKGFFQPIAFTQETYEDIYKEILLDLKSLGEDNLLVFGTELWKDASDGFQVDIANKIGTVSSLTEARRDLARDDIQTWARRRQDDREEA